MPRLHDLTNAELPTCLSCCYADKVLSTSPSASCNLTSEGGRNKIDPSGYISRNLNSNNLTPDAMKVIEDDVSYTGNALRCPKFQPLMVSYCGGCGKPINMPEWLANYIDTQFSGRVYVCSGDCSDKVLANDR